MGKLIKNGIDYSGNNIPSIQEIDSIVESKIDEYIEDMYREVDLGTVTTSIGTSADAHELYLYYEGKVPNGYTPVEITSINITSNGNDTGFPLKRLCTQFNNACLIVAIANKTGSTISVTLSASVLCIKNSFL